MFDSAAYFQSPVKGTLGKFEVAIGEIGLSPDLRCVSLSPRVTAVRTRREIERFTRRFDRLRRIGPCQAYSREHDQQLDAEETVAASNGVEKSRVGLAEGGLSVIM